jgi:signal transduction histidine kinase
MKIRMLWKLLGVNILIVAFVIVVVWLAVDYLAADYFVVLMQKYNISPTSSHAMFVGAIHRYLIWASLAAIILSVALSYFFMQRVLTPLTQMTRITGQIAEGDYTADLAIRTQDEVGELAQAFKRMAHSLRRIEQLRKTMVVDVAHELRTPLTNIQGYLEALIDDVVPPSHATIELLQAETHRLVRLVEGLLHLAQADAAKEHLDQMEISVNEALANVLPVFETKFAARSITVHTADVDPEAAIYADPHKLAQIMDNLLQNAWQYTLTNGTLRIATEEFDGSVKIIMTNTGVNLTNKDLGLVFERFFRGEKSRSREHGGAGIGLAIVKELVEVQGGQVGAAINDAETTIWFSLPSA